MRGMPRTALAASALLIAALTTAACGAHSPSAQTPSAASPGSEPWRFKPGEKAKCRDTAVARRIAAAKALPYESNENGITSQPDEVRRAGRPRAEVQAQAESWQKLSPADRLFQLCYAVDQGFSRD